jgi:hypothetical protein
MEKQCFHCLHTKPLVDFYKHKAMADGYLNKCKLCAKLDSTNYRNNNLEKVREYDKNRKNKVERIKASNEIVKLWRLQDKRRGRAHSIVYKAIKSGKLVRELCKKCNSTKTIAHHENYDEPLSVMWLCEPCHRQRHKELKKL